MSVIYNWPDRCPSCGCASFVASGREPAKLIRAAGWTGDGATLPQNTLRFACSDPTCRHTWRVELLSVAPVVFVHPRIRPLAIAAPTVAEAELLAALPDDWKAEPLTGLLARGADRVAYVTEQAAAAVGDGAG